MSNLKIENFVEKGVKTVSHKGETLLELSSLGKKAQGLKYSKSDVITIEENEYVRLSDIQISKLGKAQKVAAKKEVKNIDVKEPVFVPCDAGEDCGCLMSQEDSEKALEKCEKKK